VTREIEVFWSHSWRDNHWRKYVTLALFCNGFAALAISCAGALLAACLFAFRQLPAPEGIEDEEDPRSVWALGVGMSLYVLTLFLWRERQLVFLDVVSIDQQNPALKMKGLLSLGAFLKYSESMLVLFEGNYVKRLWCIFEIAAFLKSHPESEGTNLIMRPTMLAPCYLATTVTVFLVYVSVYLLPRSDDRVLKWAFEALLCFCGFYANTAAFREYFRSVEQMMEKLQQFKLQETACECCASGHIDAQGNPSICDRECIYMCISEWFGSVSVFEERVKTDVLRCLSQQLSSQFFTYRQCLVSTIPLAWSFLDLASARVHVAGKDPWLKGSTELVRLVAWWMGVGPVTLLVGCRLSHALRARCRWKACDLLLNCVPLLGIVVVVVVAVQVEVFCYRAMRLQTENFANMLLFAAITVPASMLLFACVGAHPQPKEVLKHETSLHQLNLNPHGHGCQIPGRSP